MISTRTLKAPTGTEISCKGWIQEAALRMLHNNLDPAVGEKPDELIVYGGTGKAARNWECFETIVKALKDLGNEETLLVQSGKAVGILPTHKDAPRVIISNSMLVPHWATWEHFHELEKKGLIMFGQMTAGSWIYIGSQGIVQGTYETFAELARKHFSTPLPSGGVGGGHSASLKKKLVVTGGLGGMGGAQPLSITMNEGVCLAAEVEESRIAKRIKTKYLDAMSDNFEDAINQALKAKEEGRAFSIGVVGNVVTLLRELKKRNIVPDVLTDQTSAHDPLNGYYAENVGVEEAKILREKDPKGYLELSMTTIAHHVELMLEFQKKGSVTFDYGNNIRGFAYERGVKNAFDFPGFVPAYIRPLFCEGKGPFRWAALSGDPDDIYETDKAILELFPQNESLHRWITLAQKRIAFQGLPARICWLGLGEREKAGLKFNELVRGGKVKAPIVIGRDHLDAGSVASPNRETEGMKDGSDAIADWPILNALLNALSGASWVSVHHGGGVGIGYSIHAGMVIVCDGTEDADRRLKRVLNNDPATGVLRHLDAGYELAEKTADRFGINLKKRLS